MLTRTGYITGPQKYGTSTSCCGHCSVYTLLITGAPWRDHITPILRQLHRLPVWRGVYFKIAVLVF